MPIINIFMSGMFRITKELIVESSYFKNILRLNDFAKS